MTAGKGARIVNVASNYAGSLDLSDLNFDKRRYDSTTAYKQSKQVLLVVLALLYAAESVRCWLLFASYLQADRMITGIASAKLFGGDASVCVNACHPGVVTSSKIPVCDVYTLFGGRGLQILVVLQLLSYLSSDIPAKISLS